MNGCSVEAVPTGMPHMIEPVARIRIELQELEPKIRRRVDVPLSSTLAALNDIIQVSFHWQDYHLYEFVVGERVYGVPSDEDEVYDRKTYKAAAIRLKTLVERGVDRASSMCTTSATTGATTLWWGVFAMAAKTRNTRRSWTVLAAVRRRTSAEPMASWSFSRRCSMRATKSMTE